MSDTHTDELSEIMDVKEPITYDEQVKSRLSFEHGALGYLNATTFNSHHND